MLQSTHSPDDQSHSAELNTFHSSNLSHMQHLTPIGPRKSGLINKLSQATPLRRKSVQFDIPHSSAAQHIGLDAFDTGQQPSQPLSSNKIVPKKEHVERFKVRRSSAIIRAFDEQLQAKAQEKNTIILGQMIEPTLNSAINQIINQRQGVNESAFAQMWSNVFFIVQSYNFFTCFFFIGIPGYPDGWWYVLEVLTEVLMIVDFIGRYVIRTCFSTAWQEMYLLQDRGGITKFNFTIRLIASAPFSIIISSSVGDNPKVLEHIGIAFVRLLKLLKFGQVMEYFSVVDFKKRQSSNYSINRAVFVFYYFMCFNHLFASVWLFCARIDHVHPQVGDSVHGVGWLVMDKLHMYSHTVYDMYRDSLFFSFSTMNNQNWGNIWATTDLEFFIHSIMDIAGASVFIGYFLTFATEWTLRNIPLYENQQKYELTKQFCEMQSIPVNLREKIRYFYSQVRLDFIQYNQKHKILQELPYSIQKQVALKFNEKIVESVKIFQRAPQEFVEKAACIMQAEISIAGDYVVRINERADKMYFIQNGSLEVIASDNVTTIALIGEGTYFGEIGVLITGKRSASVRSISNSMIYSINEKDLLNILKDFPEQEKFLRAVGFQRLNTTQVSDIRETRQNQHQIPAASGLFDDQSQAVRSSSIRTVQLTRNFSFLKRDSVPLEQQDFEFKKPIKWWLTREYGHLQHFVIMPFSYVFYLWATLMLVTFTYVAFKVLFGIGWDQNYAFDPLLIVAEVIYLADIPIRMYTGIIQPNQISSEMKQVSRYYINTWFLADLIASIPVEYVLQRYQSDVSRWLMLNKLIKVVRINETLQIFLQHTNRNQFQIMFGVYIYIYAFLSHLCACGYAYICFRSIKNSSRFDGDSMIANYAAKQYSQQRIDKLDTNTQYWWFMYLSTSIVAGQCYGDVTPSTDAEQYWTMFISTLGRILLSFILTQTQKFLDDIYKQESRHFQNRNYLKQWMKQCNLPITLQSRIQTFSEIQWRNHYKMNRSEVFESLPISIQQEIKTYMFTPLIKSWEVISGTDLGEIVSIINQLDLLTFPENEFIVKYGEVADEMYFVIDGICQVETQDGSTVMVLKQGQNFGELVLLNPDIPFRKASVRSLTTVSLAVLTRKKFNKIVLFYPQFRENLDQLVRKRQKTQMKAQRRPSEIRRQMLQQLQNSDGSESLKSSAKESVDLQSVQQSQKQKKQKLIKNDSQQPSELKTNDPDPLPFQSTNKKKKATFQIEEQSQALTTERALLTEVQPVKEKTIEKVKRAQVAPSTSSTSILKRRESAADIQSSLNKQNTLKLAEELNDHLKESQQIQSSTNCDKLFARMRLYIVKPVILLLVVWNLLFIPIHQSFKFPIKGAYLVLESLTIIVYGSEIVYRSFKLRNLYRIQKISETDLLAKERKLLQDQERLKEKEKLYKTDLILTILAVLPFNLLFDRTRWPTKIWVQVLLRTFRLTKFRPLQQAFKVFQKINLPLFRVIQVMCYNYLICNQYATVMISIVLDEPDATKNWLRRIPVPMGKGLYGFGVRKDSNILSDVSPTSLYIHAFYYIQSTLSRVAVGDISPTNLEEFLLNVFFVFSVTFLYCVLFSDIASIVSSLTSETQVAFLKNKNSLLSKLNKNVIPQIVIDKANIYFDHQYSKYNGLSESSITDMLPDRIKVDVKIAQFQTVIDSSILFRNSQTSQVDQTLANTILKTLKLQVYLSEDYVLKAGQQVQDTYLFLEGSVMIFSSFDGENLGYLGPGDFFGVDLYYQQEDQEAEREFYVSSQGEQPPRLKLEASDNFGSKALFNITAKTFITVGKLNQADMQTLYKAFPQMQRSIQKANRYLFNVGRKQLEKVLEKQATQITKEACLQILDLNYSQSTSEVYERLMRMQRVHNPSNAKDLSTLVKKYHITLQKPKYQRELRRSLIQIKQTQHEVQSNDTKITCCCEDFLIEEQSQQKRVLQILHLANMIYISFATPMYVGFNIKIRGTLLVVEIISSLISLLIFLLNFRTPFIENGQKSTNFFGVARIYLKNGMLADVLGIIPTNIMICYSVDVMNRDVSRIVCSLVALFRCTRMLSITQAQTIFEIIKLQFKKKKALVQAIGNITFVFLIGHWFVCLWVFTVYIIELNENFTWFTMLELYHRPIWAIYMINWYAVLNIVTGAGMGDVFAVTDIERVFFILAMNVGDIILAIVFGIIEHMVLSHRLDDEIENFIQRMVQIEGTMHRFELSPILKDRIQQFYVYKHKIESSPADIDATYLEKSLPQSLSRTILFYQYKDLVTPFLGQFKCENLIEDVCYHLKSKILLPEDIICHKGDTGSHMYFIVEGSLNVMGMDGKRVLNTLQAGSYFGEVALFTKLKRNATIKANTFCLLKELSQEEIDSVLVQYPQVREDLRKLVKARHQQQLARLRAPSLIAEQLNDECLKLLQATGVVQNSGINANDKESSSEDTDKPSKKKPTMSKRRSSKQLLSNYENKSERQLQRRSASSQNLLMKKVAQPSMMRRFTVEGQKIAIATALQSINNYELSPHIQVVDQDEESKQSDSDRSATSHFTSKQSRRLSDVI